MNNKKIKIMITAFISLSLLSCSSVSVIKEGNADNTTNATIDESNAKSNISPIANEDWFRNGIHMLSNPSNRVYSIVKGDGTILLTTYEPDIESVGKINDIDRNVTNYIYKNYTGEDYITMNISNTLEEFTDAIPTQRCIVYDKNGKEIGLVADTYAPSYSSANVVIYPKRDGYSNGKNYAFNVNTKESIEIDYPMIYSMNGKFLLSTSPWEDNDKEEILVCDENLNTIKKIEGYSLDNVNRVKEKEYATLRKRVKGVGDSEYKYNFLNANFNIIFENDIDDKVWTGDLSVVTLRTGGKEFEYDFINNQVVGEERIYQVNNEDEEKRKREEEINAKVEEKIMKENEVDGKQKYTYVNVFSYNGEVLYIAHLEGNRGMFDHDPIDVYDKNGEKIAEFDDLSNQFSENGYLFVDHEKIYDINMTVVGTLREKRNMDSVKKFDKYFYYDSVGLDYSTAKPFTLYNDKFEPILENLESVEMYAYDDYMVVVDSEGTKFIDKDFNVVKKLDRKLDIKSWYNDVTTFKTFEDLETGRMGIIDKDYNIVVDKLKYVGLMEEKYFTYQNGFEYGFMDYEGRPIIKYSIFDTMMEDAVRADFNGDYVVKYDDYE